MKVKAIRKEMFVLIAMVLLVFFANTNSYAYSDNYWVTGTTNYLALRSGKAYARENEIGQLYNGESVTVLDRSDSTYWYVYSPRLNKSGYVNCNYLSCSQGYSTTSYSSTYTVYGTTNYLALRNGKAYARENEIGQLYNGEIVEVIDCSDSTYWYVYSPRLGCYGYVNRNYLR